MGTWNVDKIRKHKSGEENENPSRAAHHQTQKSQVGDFPSRRKEEDEKRLETEIER